MTPGLVSIITPCFNAEGFLKETVDSVVAQTYGQWELLLIDDGSTDGTLDLARSLAAAESRIKVLVNPTNVGVAETRNHGLKSSSGEYVCFLDSDDVWLPKKLETQVGVASKGASNFLFSNYDFIDEAGAFLRTSKAPKRTTRNELLKGSFIGCLTVFVTRELLGDSKFKKTAHEDYLLWLELLAKPQCKPNYLSSVLAKYRVRAQSLSSNKKRFALHQWNIYREQLGLGVFSSAYYFTSYAIKGVRKHFL